MLNFFAINDFYILNPASMDFYWTEFILKRQRSSNRTLF